MDNNLFYVGFFSGILTMIVIGFIVAGLNMNLYNVWRWNDVTGDQSGCMLLVPKRAYGHRQEPYNCVVGPNGPYVKNVNLPVNELSKSDISSSMPALSLFK